MEGINHIYNGLGYITYALAIADGKIQNQEVNELKNFVEQEAKQRGFGPNFASILFNLIVEEGPEKNTALYIGLEEFKKHQFYLTEVLKSEIMTFLENLANAFPPIEAAEKEVLKNVRDTLWNLNNVE